MEFAICLWVPDVSAESVDQLRQQGVTAIEPGPEFLLNEDESAIVDESSRLKNAGIRIHSCHAPFSGERDLSLIDEKKREGAVATHKIALEHAAIAGASCIVIHPSGSMPPEEHEQRVDQLRRSIGELIQTAERTGVQLALENMPPAHVGCEAALVREMVDEFGSPFLGICFDIGHAHLNPGGVLSAFGILKERIITFHLQDNDGNSDRHLQPPYGTIDWEAFRPELVDLSFKNPISVEAPPWRGAPWRVFLREINAIFDTGRLEVGFRDERGSHQGGTIKSHIICRECGRFCFGIPEDWFCGCDGH